MKPKVYVIHDNTEWVKPLYHALDKLGVPYEDWLLQAGTLHLTAIPPDGIFYSRVSASGHTRGYENATAWAMPLIQWLESHGRRVINGHQTIYTEISKARQYLLLQEAGIRIPETYVANSIDQLPTLALHFEERPFILKPNRGGKGAGVQLFHTMDDLHQHINKGSNLQSPDGIYILQEYIKPPQSEIVRIEFIDGKFYYAVSVDTSGGFELCPADACEIDSLGENGATKPKFKIIEGFEVPELKKIETLLQRQKIDIAGMEFVEDESGRRYFYDINTNTNYNSDAERATGFKWEGMSEVAEFLSTKLQQHSNLQFA